ncbi:MAG: hypothetical protein U5K38_15615 [Woeseiaceae bacterium]|nr:hypothetical protein [Woeseiaceae bacterium]
MARTSRTSRRFARTQLPPNFAGGPAFPVPSLSGPKATFSPLNKGRVYGLEIMYHYQ